MKSERERGIWIKRVCGHHVPIYRCDRPVCLLIKGYGKRYHHLGAGSSAYPRRNSFRGNFQVLRLLLGAAADAAAQHCTFKLSIDSHPMQTVKQNGHRIWPLPQPPSDTPRWSIRSRVRTTDPVSPKTVENVTGHIHAAYKSIYTVRLFTCRARARPCVCAVSLCDAWTRVCIYRHYKEPVDQERPFLRYDRISFPRNF